MKRCPQCESLYCGQIACRFSGLTHDAFKARQALLADFRENDYSQAMQEEDKRGAARPEHDLDVSGRPLRAGS